MLETFQELRAVPGRVPYAAYAAAMSAWEAQRTTEDSQNTKRGVASKQLKVFQESLGTKMRGIHRRLTTILGLRCRGIS